MNIQVENPYPNPDSFTGSLHLSKLQYFFLWKFEINLTPGNGFRMGGVSDSWLLLVVDNFFPLVVRVILRRLTYRSSYNSRPQAFPVLTTDEPEMVAKKTWKPVVTEPGALIQGHCPAEPA